MPGWGKGKDKDANKNLPVREIFEIRVKGI